MTTKIHYGLNGWQYWYCRVWKCWLAAQFDAAGNQLAESINAYTKGEIEAEIS